VHGHTGFRERDFRKCSEHLRKHFNDRKCKRSDVCAQHAVLDWRFYPAIAAWLIFLLLVRAIETKSVVRKLSTYAASGVFVILSFASGCGGGSTTTTPAARHTQRKLHNHSERSGKHLPAQTYFSHADRELKFIFRS